MISKSKQYNNIPAQHSQIWIDHVFRSEPQDDAMERLQRGRLVVGTELGNVLQDSLFGQLLFQDVERRSSCKTKIII